MIYHSIQIQFNVSQQASAPQDSNGLRTSPCISMRLVSTHGKHWELDMFCRLSCCNSSHARAILTCLPMSPPHWGSTPPKLDQTHPLCPGITGAILGAGSRSLRCKEAQLWSFQVLSRPWQRNPCTKGKD